MSLKRGFQRRNTANAEKFDRRISPEQFFLVLLIFQSSFKIEDFIWILIRMWKNVEKSFSLFWEMIRDFCEDLFFF
jgi:hypothetical protein